MSSAPLAKHLHTPTEGLRTLVANSATFQAVTGSADAAEAMGRVAYWFAEDPIPEDDDKQDVEMPRPRAIVSVDEWGKIRASTTGWPFAGIWVIQFELLTAGQGDTLNERAQWFGEVMEKILDELVALVNTNQYVAVQEITLPGALNYGDPKYNGGLDEWWICEVGMRLRG